jgi:hypothetical protein
MLSAASVLQARSSPEIANLGHVSLTINKDVARLDVAMNDIYTHKQEPIMKGINNEQAEISLLLWQWSRP